MQNLKQPTRLKVFNTSLLAFFTMLLLFSCSKNQVDIPGRESGELSVSQSSSQSQNENTIHAVPFETTVFVPCANGGAGENVELTGFTNFVYQLAWNETRFVMPYHDNVHGVTGVGAISGEQFVASGGTNGTVMGSWVNSQWIGTLIRQLRIIGRNTQFTVTYKYHITVTSDGTVVVKNTDQTAACN